MLEFMDLTPLFREEIDKISQEAVAEFEHWEELNRQDLSCIITCPDAPHRKCIRLAKHAGPHYCHFSSKYPLIYW